MSQELVDRKTGEIVVRNSPGYIQPVDDAEAILAAWHQFQKLKQAILEPSDYVDIQGRKAIKKSGWRKIAAAFGISDEVRREYRSDRQTAKGDPYFVWEVTARATAPNGRYAEALGSCSSLERKFAHVDHDVRAQASTRAKNRAIADLVGGGEVSAEELGAATTPVKSKQLARDTPTERWDKMYAAVEQQTGFERESVLENLDFDPQTVSMEEDVTLEEIYFRILRKLQPDLDP